MKMLIVFTHPELKSSNEHLNDLEVQKLNYGEYKVLCHFIMCFKVALGREVNYYV